MKILYISTVFPRPENSSTIYTDLAEALKKHGHEIIVVATTDAANFVKSQLVLERNIPVLRVKTGKMYNVGFIQKSISLLLLKFHLIKAIKNNLSTNKFDFILFESPPVTISSVIKWAMKYFGCPSYLMLKDIFPQNAVDLEIMKNKGLIYRYFKNKEKELYSISTIIGCMSEANISYLIQHNSYLDKNKIELFPNTKCINYSSSKPIDYIMRRRYGIPEEAVVPVFGGNMGRPQGLDFLMDIIKANRDNKTIFFLLVGRGTEHLKINSCISKEKLCNVLLLDGLPRLDYEALIAECDIGLIILNKKFTIPNYPSRILSYFEYGLPVLAATDKNTDFKNLIENSGSGHWIEAGNIDEFNLKLNDLANSEQKRNDFGRSGRQYLEDNFNVNVSVKILEKHFAV